MTRVALLALAAVLGACATDAPPPAATEPTRAERDAPPAAVATLPPATAEPTAAPAPAADAPPDHARLDLPLIEKTFDRHKRYFHKLYQDRVAKRPGLAGAMLVDFLVNPDGSTRDVTMAESNLGDPEFEQAVLAQIGAMAFPPAQSPTPVRRYPIYFTPRGKK